MVRFMEGECLCFCVVWMVICVWGGSFGVNNVKFCYFGLIIIISIVGVVFWYSSDGCLCNYFGRICYDMMGVDWWRVCWDEVKRWSG